MFGKNSKRAAHYNFIRRNLTRPARMQSALADCWGRNRRLPDSLRRLGQIQGIYQAGTISGGLLIQGQEKIQKISAWQPGSHDQKPPSQYDRPINLAHQEADAGKETGDERKEPPGSATAFTAAKCQIWKIRGTRPGPFLYKQYYINFAPGFWHFAWFS